MPEITTTDIIDMFHDADHFTVEGLKLVPQNKEHKEYLLKLTGLKSSDFTQMGLLTLMFATILILLWTALSITEKTRLCER